MWGQHYWGQNYWGGRYWSHGGSAETPPEYREVINLGFARISRSIAFRAEILTQPDLEARIRTRVVLRTEN